MYQMTRMSVQGGRVGLHVQFMAKTTTKREFYFTIKAMAANVRKAWELSHAAYKTANGSYFIPSKVG